VQLGNTISAIAVPLVDNGAVSLIKSALNVGDLLKKKWMKEW